SLAFMDPFTDNFAYVGTRTTGGQAGKYLITGPEWAGSAPPGMQRISAPSNFVWLLGRFLVDPPSDVVHVVRLQDSLTPVSACRSAVAPRV
ncbi:MAG TPA: DUF1254 domain-containing protein, partial [Candidatus Dormibacteraeota bacterium]|nr:DUF1254 domain-containing protein [Candidatus Dormibacteraeota bacterium]